MTINDDLWAARLPNGDIRSGTLEQLDEAFRAGHLSESTLVYGSRTDSWIPLADALAAANAGAASTAVAAPSASVPAPPVAAPPAAPVVASGADVWQVRLPNGEVRSGTLEQLVEALHAGHLNEDVLVLAAGTRDWVRLGAAMGRNAPVAPVASSAHPPRSVAPQPVAPQPVAPPQVAPPQVAPRSVAPGRVSAPPPSTTPAQADGADDVCQVRLADGQVRSGTRQQLEEAFHAGHLDGATLVLAAGAREWVPLATLGDPRASAAPPPAQVAPPEPPPVEVQPATPVVAPQEKPVSATEEAPAAPALDASPPAQTDDGKPDLQAAWDGDQVWQVHLSGTQLKRAFNEGVLDDDAMVLAVGTEQWLKLGDVRRAPSDPTATPSAEHSGNDATPAINGAAAEADAPGE